jgi:hypothetical protein
MLWSTPEIGVDLPRSGPAAAAMSPTTSQAFTMRAVDIHSIREKPSVGGVRRRRIE